MRLKISIKDDENINSMINGVSWTMNNEIYYSGDDKCVYKYSPINKEKSKFMEFDSHPIDLDWLPITKGVNDVFAVGFADGSFQIITKLAQIEKKVNEAHKSAITSLKWSHEGGSLATAGEDGQIKTWSKNGNLRSTLVQSESVIYCLSWGPDSETLCYCSDSNIFIKSLQAGQKTQQWKAHDGLVLKVDWNASNNLILSGGEDCKYKLWDSYGRLLFASQCYDYVINSVKWASNGEYFAVGAFNMIRLCDKSGWTYNYEKTNCGTMFNLSWSADSTMLAGASGNGSLLVGTIVDKVLKNDQFELTLHEDNQIYVLDLIHQHNETLTFKSTVINMQLGFGYLVVLTQNQCFVYSVSNWNAPHVFEVKESVSNIIISSKYMALVMLQSGINIFTYDGKLQSNPKTPNIKFQFLNIKQIALSQDVLALIDGTDNKKIIFFDTQNGKKLNFELEHFIEIQDISLNQNEQAQERKIGFIDQNRDLYISPIVKKDKVKLSCMVDSFMFNEKNDILTAIADERLLVWYYLNGLQVDKELMELCKTSKDCSDIQRMSQIISFSQSTVNIRRKDGGIISLSVSPYPSLLFDLCEKNGWQKAVKLCRYVKEQTLWACLAAVALYHKELNSAEIALAAIDCADKVQFIIYVKELKSDLVRNAALALYFHKQNESESMLVNSKLYYRAIKLNIKLYHWERALDLAINYKIHLDTVLAYRQRYLQRIQKEEWMDKFKQVEKKVEIDWSIIKANIKQEKERESKLR